MKIEITQYDHKATYEFSHEDIDLDELLFHLGGLLRLVGYVFDGQLEIVNEKFKKEEQ